MEVQMVSIYLNYMFSDFKCWAIISPGDTQGRN